MVKKLVAYCDLCVADGYEGIRAVARYWDEENKEWDVCDKHLAVVKAAGLDYEE